MKESNISNKSPSPDRESDLKKDNLIEEDFYSSHIRDANFDEILMEIEEEMGLKPVELTDIHKDLGEIERENDLNKLLLKALGEENKYSINGRRGFVIYDIEGRCLNDNMKFVFYGVFPGPFVHEEGKLEEILIDLENKQELRDVGEITRAVYRTDLSLFSRCTEEYSEVDVFSTRRGKTRIKYILNSAADYLPVKDIKKDLNIGDVVRLYSDVTNSDNGFYYLISNFGGSREDGFFWTLREIKNTRKSAAVVKYNLSSFSEERLRSTKIERVSSRIIDKLGGDVKLEANKIKMRFGVLE